MQSGGKVVSICKHAELLEEPAVLSVEHVSLQSELFVYLNPHLEDANQKELGFSQFDL